MKEEKSLTEFATCKNCQNEDSGFCKEHKKDVTGDEYCSSFDEKRELLLDNLNLESLHHIYRKLLYIEDTKRIDVVLATALSHQLEGIPIWLFLVGASGDMKSVQLNALEGFNTHYLHKITSKTLVNGYRDKEKYPDLAPSLNDKIVVIRDLAALLKLPAIEKGEVWGQLRDLYDGFAGAASGMGMDIKYKGIKVTMLAGSTHAIDGQILIHQDLGTRELIYRTKGNENKKKVMEKCLENEEYERKITEELNEVTLRFLKSIKIERKHIPDSIMDKLKEIAVYVSYMRASAEYDSFSHEIRNDVHPEEPTRIIKQLKRLFICLKSLDPKYKTDKAIKILWKLAKSSAFPMRVKIFNYLLKNNGKEFSTSRLSELLKIGKSTSQRELHALWNMNLVSLRKEATTYPDRFYDYWKLNMEHQFIADLQGNRLEK